MEEKKHVVLLEIERKKSKLFQPIILKIFIQKKRTQMRGNQIYLNKVV